MSKAIEELKTEDILELLPPRYINHPFDEIFMLRIFKSSGMWYVRYENTGKKDSFVQQASLEIRLAAIEMIKHLKKNQIGKL